MAEDIVGGLMKFYEMVDILGTWMRLAWYVAYMGYKRKQHRILIRKTHEEKSL
jgi:hypothetical protein